MKNFATAEDLQEVYIIDAVRTPVGKAGGNFKNYRPDDLLTMVLKGLLAKLPALNLAQIDDVIIGCAMPEAEQGMNVARTSSLMAGIPISVPAVTINRFCASGLETIARAADQIALGRAQLIVAGGVESMTRVPIGGFNYAPNLKWFTGDEEQQGIALSMGITAEKVADKWSISRAEQDEFALLSHQRALESIKQHYFTREIVAIDNINCDEGPRENCTLEGLSKLSPVFAKQGTVTAGNSSQMSDAAGAVLLASKSFVYKNDLTPLAKFLGYAVSGVSPALMGIGPTMAIPKLLTHMGGVELGDFEWIELNEAFAAQAVAVIKILDLDHNKVNPQGGAIALGHPLGATGAVRTATLLHGMQRCNKKLGMVTMCVGTGMGAAGAFEII